MLVELVIDEIWRPLTLSSEQPDVIKSALAGVLAETVERMIDARVDAHTFSGRLVIRVETTLT